MRLTLPPVTQKKEVEAALQRQHSAGEMELMQSAMTWTRLHWYLKGLRRFRGVWASGNTAFEDESGRRTVPWEKALSLRQTEIGRLLSVDVRPAVLRPEGVSLKGIRDAAISQASLEYLIGRWDLDAVKMQMAMHLTDYGQCSLQVHGPSSPSVRQLPGVEVVPVWETMPLPSCPTGLHDVCGIVRRRWVDLTWLKQNMSRLVRSWPSAEEMKAREAPPGTVLQTSGDPDSGGTHGDADIVALNDGMDTAPGAKSRGATKKAQYVLLKEFYLYGPEAYSVRRWSVMAGPRLLYDIDYDPDEEGLDLPICPLQVVRYNPVGSFYARGFIDRLYALNSVLERILGNFAQNLEDLDWLGITMIPADMGMNQSQFKKARKDRFGTFMPDLTNPKDLRPFIMGPTRGGDQGASGIQLLGGLMQDLSNQGELLSGGVPGRVDSARALGVLLESQNVPLAPVSESIAQAFTGVYKALLQLAPSVIPQKFDLKLVQLDEMVLGLNVSPSGEVSVNPEQIPSPYDIRLTIRNKAPESKQAKLAALQELLTAGVISRVDFEITALKEGLDLPILNREAFESYKKAWWENVILFGDGETPGEITASRAGDNHVIHIRVLKELMASVAFAQSSDDVYNAVMEHFQFHESFLGPIPEGLLTPDQFGGAQDASQAIPPELQQAMMAG